MVYSDLTRLQARFGEHVDPRFPGWNMDCSDHAVREPEWEREFHRYERNNNLPGLEIVYFPNDHTQGTAAKLATPRSYMADNDLALGRLVDTVSHSKYWSSTAIFVLEDDAQDGPGDFEVWSPERAREGVAETAGDSGNERKSVASELHLARANEIEIDK